MAVDPIKYNQISVVGTLAAGDTVLGEKVNGITGRLIVGDLLAFKTLVISGQSDIVANSLADTLTIVAGTGITLTTNAPTDTLTISSSVRGGGLGAYTTTDSDVGTTMLTVSSNYQQFVTGAAPFIVVMPVTSTLVLGQSWLIVNNSTEAVTVNSSGANLIATLGAGATQIITCILTSGTTAASWDSKVPFNPNATAGLQNVVVGTNAGDSITSGGSYNTCVGYDAGTSITTSDNNVAIGYQALDAVTTSSSATAVGSGALGALTSGTGMVAIGYLAGSALTTQAEGVFIGTQAGSSNTGSANVMIGNTVSASGTASRNNNVIIGNSAANLATGSSSIVIGNGNAGRQHAGQAVYVGHNSGQNCTGADNVGIGWNALSDGTGGAGTDNVAIGTGAMIAGASGAIVFTSASGNTCVGSRAGIDSATCLNAIAVGRDAVTTIATGVTPGTNGPGIAIGSAAYPVGFRGDGTIYAAVGASAGYWRLKINGTVYKINLFAD